MTKKKASASAARAQLDLVRAKTGWSKSGLRDLLQPAKARGKGGKFERDAARDFSLWWSGGARDDIFWRTGGSGGRATARNKAGKHTAGQYGDLAATDPTGVALTTWGTIELKRGYQHAHVGNLLDRRDNTKQTDLGRFFEQAMTSHQQAGSHTWMIVHARDRRTPIVWLPVAALKVLVDVGAIGDKGAIRPLLIFNGHARINRTLQPVKAVGLTLPVFFDQVKPDAIRNLVNA